MSKIKTLIICLITITSYSQTDVDKILKGGEIIVNGLSFLKKDKSEAKETNSKIIESVCIKNKLDMQIKITV